MIQFKENQVYTIISIGCIGTTAKSILKFSRYLNDKPLFKELPRGRKEFSLRVEPKDMLVFEGLQKPFICDSETNSFYGNFRINLIGESETIIKFIEENNLNPRVDKSNINLVIEKETGREYINLYPESQEGEEMLINFNARE